MSSQRQTDVWAQALVEASIVGDVVTAEKYKVTERTIRNWRRWVKTDPELRQLYEEKMSRVGAEFADSLTTRSPLLVVRRQTSSDPGIKRAAVELADAAAAEIVAVAALCDLPEVKAVERSHYLPSGHVIDLLVSHRDESYSVCQVLTDTSVLKAPRALGHLLFCFESIRMHYRLPASLVRLCVLADHNAPPLWNRVVVNVSVQIKFVNILEVVREHLSSLEVAASGPPKQRRRRAGSKRSEGYRCGTDRAAEASS